jgi:hypothetical protein
MATIPTARAVGYIYLAPAGAFKHIAPAGAFKAPCAPDAKNGNALSLEKEHYRPFA